MLIRSLVSLSVMLFGCLDLDSCAGMGHVVEHEYDTLLSRTPDDLPATPGKFGNSNDPMSPFPALEQPFLINPHDKINTSLGPKATKHSKMIPAQRQKAKFSRRLKALTHTHKKR